MTVRGLVFSFFLLFFDVNIPHIDLQNIFITVTRQNRSEEDQVTSNSNTISDSFHSPESDGDAYL